MKDKLILLTNDDGIKSQGLYSLKKYLNKIGKVECFAPTEPSSAVSKALTFHKPIRFYSYNFEDGTTGYSTTGSPADNVLVGFHVLKRKPDVVVSGINYGDNSSIHSILTSGTCAAAFEAGFNKVPAIAFSADVSDDAQLIDQRGVDFDHFARISKEIVELVLELDWPKDLAFLNVNYPTEITEETKVYVTVPTVYKYDNYMVEKKDPRNLTYLWLWGERKKTFPENTDSWAVIHKKGISISPIAFNLHEKTDQSLKLAETVQKHIKIDL
ncbi:MAG: 5'/3'-nucleotidase SurE [Candidatus Heimdallarchaeota archaeon]|nr:5'/3'-nucleotidase SurE [Candidatus Heimdallarchaeota archaeon]MCK4878423.1 5'/3'-nucleotidase SurE [Candidatus Heimdallarchaeota archaeon]